MASLYAGELEVDGDLNVTGTIQSQTIDSLIQIIANLETQISNLQSSSGSAGWETRLYEYDFSLICNEPHVVSLDILNNIDYGILNVVTVQNLNSNSIMTDAIVLKLETPNSSRMHIYIEELGGPQSGWYWKFDEPGFEDIYITPYTEHSGISQQNNSLVMFIDQCSDEDLNGTIHFVITAQFPN